MTTEATQQTPVSKLIPLAIAAAKNGDWIKAVEFNEAIIVQAPEDISALNRLGLAHLQLSNESAAKEQFQRVLKIDKQNSIAQKQLERIKTKQPFMQPTFSKNYFIEEPGRTKIVELHRLAGKQVLDTLCVGHTCKLTVKKRYISVETEDNRYIGALPEDISFRLAQLMETGNVYGCTIQSCCNNQCMVYLKELSRSKANMDVHSFPPSRSALSGDTEDRLALFDDLEEGDGEFLNDPEGEDTDTLEEDSSKETEREQVSYDD